MNIDASELIKRLGIRHPVNIVGEDLTFIQALGATHPLKQDELRIDLDAINVYRGTGGLPSNYRAAVAEIVAHEMTHIAQMQRFDSPMDAVMAYNAQPDYETNPFEVEARERQSDLSRYVYVS